MAPVVAKKGSSTSKIAPEPSAPTGRIGSSKEVSCKSEPSGMASKSEPPGTALPAPRPFLSISNDLCGLVISSWLVPTVRRPRKGVLTFVGALLAQLGFLLYMVEIIIHGGKSTCETPALLQLVALYTFGSACAAGSHSDNLLQVALVCQRLRLPAAPVADSHGRLTQGSEVIIPVRPTSRRARMLLACAPLASMLIELLTLCVGPISSALFHQSMPLLSSSIHGRRCLPALVCDHRGADSKRGGDELRDADRRGDAHRVCAPRVARSAEQVPVRASVGRRRGRHPAEECERSVEVARAQTGAAATRLAAARHRHGRCRASVRQPSGRRVVQLRLPSRERGSRGCLTSGRACRCRRMHLSFTNDKLRASWGCARASLLSVSARKFVAGIAHAHFRFFISASTTNMCVLSCDSPRTRPADSWGLAPRHGARAGRTGAVPFPSPPSCRRDTTGKAGLSATRPVPPQLPLHIASPAAPAPNFAASAAACPLYQASSRRPDRRRCSRRQTRRR